MSKNYAFVATYSFDDDTAVYLFEKEEDAVAMLRKTFEDECRSDAENGYENETYIREDGWYASIRNYRRDGSEDLTEYRVGHIYG